MLVLTQYKAMSLDRHINLGWRHYFCRELGEFIDVVPPQQRIDEHWYQGTADAVYQNIYTLEKERPEYVVILAGDHIYKMNYKAMVEYHIDVGADLTVGALRVDPVEARAVRRDGGRRRTSGSSAFEEKPPNPKPIPGDPEHCLASMGIYVFTARFLFEQLCRDATQARQPARLRPRTSFPSIIDTHRVFAFPFRDENRKSDAYWRDVGTLDAYYEANMDLISVDPLLNLYDEVWPIRTFQPNLPPPKFVFGSRGERDRARPGARQHRLPGLDRLRRPRRAVRSSARTCRVNSYAHVEDSILFDGVDVGRHAQIRRAIIDKGVQIPAGIEIGYDLEHDRRRGFTISDGGIVVIAKADGLEHMG